MGFNKTDIIYIYMEKPALDLKVALCGPSGSGKSTLATKISELKGLRYTENSAGLLLSPEDQEFLMNQYGWTKSGHKDVIKLSHQNSGFAWEFQWRLLLTRMVFIQNNHNFVIDRSPVDNLTYFLLQSAIMVTPELTEKFIWWAQKALEGLTHIIFIPTMLTGEIENNGSRIANYEYQRLVTASFEHVWDTYFARMPIKRLRLDTHDFEERVKLVEDFLKS